MTEHDALLGLRAMKAVAKADHWIADEERALLRASAQALGLDSLDSDDIAGIEPEALRAVTTSDQTRRRIVQAMILMAMMDGEIDQAEIDIIKTYAEALDIDEPRIHNLTQLARGRTVVMWLDLARRSPVRRIFEDHYTREGLRGVWKIVGTFMGGARDPALAARYRATEACAAGTLGRHYWEFMTRYGFPFPGEAFSVPESGVWHDMAHVLSGYDASPQEEVYVVSFVAGFSKEDPFFWLFTIALQYQLGLRVSPYSMADTGLMKPKETLEALRRGAAMNVDLVSWDYWPHLDTPLRRVQEMLNIPPLADLVGVHSID